MKVFIPLIFVFGMGIDSFAQNLNMTVHEDPANVVNAIFEAAKTKNWQICTDLCDPEEQNDGDTRNICELSNSNQKTKDEFSKIFKDGKINGTIVFMPLEDATLTAEIPIWINHPGGPARSNETMILVNRNRKWYLLSF